MGQIEIIPAIDLRAGKVVRLLKGDYNQQIDYEEDPSSLADQFRAAGAKRIHVVDLDGAREGQLCNLPAIRTILDETDLDIEVGGGIRSRETIMELLDAGVERVILGTAALDNWKWIETILGEEALAGRIVLGLDARKGKIALEGWTRQSNLSAVEIARRVSDWPLAAIIYTDIARDGMMTGPNLDAVAEIAGATSVPIIASGGVGTLEHVKALLDLPIAGIIIGRALYEGRIHLANAVRLSG